MSVLYLSVVIFIGILDLTYSSLMRWMCKCRLYIYMYVPTYLRMYPLEYM